MSTYGFFDETEHSEREFVFDIGTSKVSQKVLGWSYGGCDVVWNDLMCWFVLCNEPLFRGKSVLELGSGCGLVGLVAAHCAANVTLTDGDESEMPLLARNVELYSPEGCEVRAKFLDWGDEIAEERYDVVIGQEIVYMPKCVPLLAKTIKRRLRPDGHAYIGNKRHATNTTAEEVKACFLDALHKEGLTAEELALSFSPCVNELAESDPTYVLRITHAKVNLDSCQ